MRDLDRGCRFFRLRRGNLDHGSCGVVLGEGLGARAMRKNSTGMRMVVQSPKSHEFAAVRASAHNQDPRRIRANLEKKSHTGLDSLAWPPLVASPSPETGPQSRTAWRSSA